MKHFLQATIIIFIFSLLSCGFAGYRLASTSMEGTILIGERITIQEKRQYVNNDIVAFKHTDDNSEEVWVSRIIAQSGDKLEIKEGDVYVNDLKIPDPPNIKIAYVIKTSSELYLEKYKNFEITQNEYNEYVGFLTSDQLKKLSENTVILSITKQIFPKENEFPIDFLGPVLIPPVGKKTEINKQNEFLFKNVPSENITKITPKEKLYFLLGDNRHNAADSRYIGLISFSDIVGAVRK